MSTLDLQPCDSHLRRSSFEFRSSSDLACQVLYIFNFHASAVHGPVCHHSFLSREHVPADGEVAAPPSHPEYVIVRRGVEQRTRAQCGRVTCARSINDFFALICPLSLPRSFARAQRQSREQTPLVRTSVSHKPFFVSTSFSGFPAANVLKLLTHCWCVPVWTVFRAGDSVQISYL